MTRSHESCSFPTCFREEMPIPSTPIRAWCTAGGAPGAGARASACKTEYTITSRRHIPRFCHDCAELVSSPRPTACFRPTRPGHLSSIGDEKGRKTAFCTGDVVMYRYLSGSKTNGPIG